MKFEFHIFFTCEIKVELRKLISHVKLLLLIIM